MRNPSAYVPNFLNSQICCILSKFKNFIFAKIFDFKFSHRRESTRRGGVANFTGAAAFGGGVHPCNPDPPKPSLFQKKSSKSPKTQKTGCAYSENYTK